MYLDMLHTNKSAHVYRTREMNILAYSITVEGTRAKQKPSSRSVTPAQTTSDGLPTWIPREAQKPTRVITFVKQITGTVQRQLFSLKTPG